jgi:hypothetical protein
VTTARHAWPGAVGAWLAGACLLAAPATAASITLAGITFSDELGGVVLHAGSGAGTVADPFVLVEEINDDGPAILIVRGLRGRLGDLADAQRQLGFSLEKIVTNHTSRAWHSFELELRERLDQPSTYEDGLSFAQAMRSQRPFSSDRFRTVEMNDEPLDSVVFSDGLVAPGETVTVSVAITDYTPGEEFFLLQRREAPIAGMLRAGHAG